MKRVSNLVIYGLITAAIAVAIITTNILPLSSWATANSQESQPTITAPKRLNITVKVASPEDLKIAEGQEIKQGDIIADRQRERTRLTAQQKQLQLSLDRLKAASITPPAAPAAVPPVMALPPISYLEQEAAVEKTKSQIASISSEVELKQQEIKYLAGVKNLDPIILEHERVKLAQLKRNQTAAVREYQLAIGKMQTAKNQRQYQEYQASLNSARRVEEMNQARLNYQRQLAEYEQRLADREFQVTQLQEKLNNVDDRMANLSAVKAPYAGTVRRIRWLGQSPDGSLTAEVILMVNNSQQSRKTDNRTPLPQQQ